MILLHKSQRNGTIFFLIADKILLENREKLLILLDFVL